jgi:hypothetical protein
MKEEITERSSLFFVMGVGTLFLFLIIFFTISEFASFLPIQSKGVETEAVVIEKWIDTTTRFSSYYVQYQFVVDSTSIVKTEEVSFGTYRRLEANNPVTIKYLEGETITSQIAAMPPSVIMGVSLVLLLMTIIIILGSIKLTGFTTAFMSNYRVNSKEKWYDETIKHSPLILAMAFSFSVMATIIDQSFDRLLLRFSFFFFTIMLIVLVLTNYEIAVPKLTSVDRRLLILFAFLGMFIIVMLAFFL